MYVKICRQMDGEPDTTIIETDEIRFCTDMPREDGKDVRLLEIHPTNKREGDVTKHLVWGNQMQVYLMNSEGKTIERLW